MSLILGTNAVTMDEPCFSLKELTQPAPDSKSVRRYQILRVIRQGDKLAEFRRDLGPASAFQADEFVIPGGVSDARGRMEIVHTVGELMDIADLVRSDRYDRPERPAPSDLIRQYQDLPDHRRRRRKAASQFGPAARIQRS